MRRPSRPPSVHAAEFSKTVAPLLRGNSSDRPRPGETTPRREKRTAEYSAAMGPPGGFPGLLRNHMDGHPAVARPVVEVDQHHLLPRPEGQLGVGEWCPRPGAHEW